MSAACTDCPLGNKLETFFSLLLLLLLLLCLIRVKYFSALSHSEFQCVLRSAFYVSDYSSESYLAGGNENIGRENSDICAALQSTSLISSLELVLQFYNVKSYPGC